MKSGFRRILLLVLTLWGAFQAKSQCTGSLITIPPTCGSPSGYSLVIPNSLACTQATPYTIIWIPGSGCQNPTLTTVPGPGTYVVTFTAPCTQAYSAVFQDNNGTFFGSASATTGVSSPTTLSITPISAIQPSCHGYCNGSRSIIWTGTGPVAYTLDPASTTSVTGSNVPTGFPVTFTSLCAGTHTLFATDGNGCTFTTGLTFTLGEPATLTATATQSNVTCFGGSNGTFSVIPTGGNTSYTVTFSRGTTTMVTTTPGGTASISGLTQGPITATVTDNKNCTATVSAVITEPTSITIVPTVTNIICGGICSGAASVAISGGGTTYSVSWDGSPSLPPTSASSLCAGNHNAAITDNFGCTVNQTFVITSPAPLALTQTVVNAVCSATCNGSATVAPSGGTGALVINWVAPGNATISTTTTASALCANVYTVVVTDINNCVLNQTLAVTQPPSLTLAVTVNSISCINTPTGSASATLTGGNGSPVTYAWLSAPSTTISTANSVTGLAAGSYTLISADRLGCSASTVITVLQPNTFTYAVSTTSNPCNGQCVGTMSAVPIGGVSPFSYTLASGSTTLTSTTGTFGSLCAANYTLSVLDAISTCPQTTVIPIAEPNALGVSLSSTTITCHGLCNGALSASGSGGTPAYTFTWSTPSGTASGAALSSLCAGNYLVTISDGNACSTTQSITLTQPTSMTVSVNSTSVNCFSACNGALNANVSGGTPGYTVRWSTGFVGNPVTSLCSGPYTYTVTDNNGCTALASASVASASSITIQNTTQPTKCAGTCDGGVTFTTTGGTGAFSYTVNTAPPSSNGTGIFTNLCAGNYIVSVRDANACTTASNITITSPLALSASISNFINSCVACTGAATVAPAGGTPGFSYVWTNSVSTVVSTLNVASSLCAGDYSVTITDSQLCTATTTLHLGQTVIAPVVNGGTGIGCFGACTGSAVANPTGGSGTYTYLWNTVPAQTTQTATGLCAGVYNVTVTEVGGTGCSASNSVTVTQPASITVASGFTNTTCFGACSGVISATATGGSGALSYSWSPGGSSSNSITGLCAGAYQLHVTDANNCTVAPLSFSISQPPALAASYTFVAPTTCTLNNGGICASASGGTGSSYNYTWMPGGSTGSCLTSVAAGSYTLTIADVVGCTTTLSTILNNPTGPTLSIAQQSVACFGASTGGATVTATSGLGGPYSYTWSPAVTGNTSSVNGIPSGNYVISVTDGAACVTSSAINIPEASSIAVTATVTDAQCSNILNGSIVIQPSGGTPGYSYSWSGPSLTATTQNVSGLVGGSYTVNLLDAHSCTGTAVYSISVPPPIVLNTVSQKTVICTGATCNASIAVQASGGNGTTYNYTWSPVGAFTGSTTATVLNLCNNVYTVTATDMLGCVTTQTYQVITTLMTSSISVKNETCGNDCTGGAHIAVSNAGPAAAPSYTVSWSSGTVSANSISGLCAGNYVGNLVDGDGCTATHSFAIGKTPLSATLVPTPASCSGSNNASITTSYSGVQGSPSFSWSPGGSGQNPSNLPPGIYTLTLSDDSLCQFVSVVTINNTSPLQANVLLQNPACTGNCNGIAAITASFAAGSTTVTWGHTASTNATLTNLCGNTPYSFTLTDGNGCQDASTFTLTNPSPISLLAGVGPASCGANNGSITIVATGGTTVAPAPGYTVTWNPNVSTGLTATSLTAQTYSIHVVDGQGCFSDITVPLSNSNGPTAPITSTDNICAGICLGTGSIGAISGSSPPYNSYWTYPNTSTTAANPITGLCAGNYLSTITDNIGCITYSTITITQPANITVNSNIGIPTCNGICNGSLSVSVFGGAGTFTYNWLPAQPNTSVLTSLCPNVYTLNLTYNNTCTHTPLTFTVPSQINLPSPQATFTNNNCYNECHGRIALFEPNGSVPGPFTFAWSNGLFSPGPNNSTIGSLCTGDYSVIISSSNGCNNTFTYNIAPVPQVTLTSAVVQPSCNMCNGSATVSAAGGNGTSFSYNWSSGPATPTLNGMCAGVYVINVVDNLNCQSAQTLIVNNSNGITSENFNVNNERCAGDCNGSVTVTAIGGTAPYAYNWINPAALGNTLTGLCAGTYFVAMSDVNGCIRNASVALTPAVQLTLNTFVTPPTCGPPPYDGTVITAVAGGTPGYSYLWMPGSITTSSLVNIGPGTYTVTVTDNSTGGGCSLTRTINISNLNAPVYTSTIQNVNCFGQCTGGVSLTVTGPGGVQPVYAWSNGGTSSSVSGLCSGLVSFTVTDNTTGCIAIDSYSIPENPALTIATTSINSRCANECLAEISVMPLGGTFPYTFAWSSLTVTSSHVDSLCAGNYSLTVTDALGCVQTQTVHFTDPPRLHLSAIYKNVTCSSLADGAATVTPTGGTPRYTLTWNGPNGFTGSGTAINNLSPGNYSVAIRDSLSCRRDTVLSIIPTLTVIADAGHDTLACPGGSISLSARGSQGALNYFWYQLPDITNPVSTAVNNDILDVSGDNSYMLVITSAVPGCSSTAQVSVGTYVQPYLDAGPSYTISLFSSTVIGGNPTAYRTDSITWYPAAGLNDTHVLNPIASNTVNTTYYVMIPYGRGCVATDSVQVNIYPEILVRSGFTPNNDGKNDKWIIENIEQFPDCSVEVFNRWGEPLFFSRGYQVPWDGTFKGNQLPVGTYYYVIHVNHPAYSKPYTGPVTIFR